MMKFRKTKPALIGLALMFAGSLSACGKTNDNTTEKLTEKATIATEAKTEEITTEEITTEAKVDTKEVEFYNLAGNSYNDYTEFYARSKMAYKDEEARDNINIQRIENMIKVINGEVADLTSDEVINAKEDMNYVLLSQDLVTDLDDIIARDLGYVNIEGNMQICEAPKLSIYASDEETREFVEKYERLRDQVHDDINKTNAVSDKTKNDLKNAVIEMEKEYLPERNEMNSDVTAEGNKLLLNLSKESLVELTALATNESRIMTDEFPGGLKLIAETDGERDIDSAALLLRGKELLGSKELSDIKQLELAKELSDIKQLELAILDMESIVTKYEEGVCAHMENLANHAKSNTNTHSKIELLKNKKAILEAYQEQIENYTYSM